MVWEIIWIGGCILLGLLSGFSIVRTHLNLARVRLERLGMPMTVKNIFFIRAHEIEAARRASQAQEGADGTLVEHELLVSQLEARGLTREQATEVALVRTRAGRSSDG